MASQPPLATAERRTLTSLWIQIQNNRVEALDGRKFVPPTSLSTIFTPAAITAAVAELPCAPEDRLGLADAIGRGGVPTFAVLVWMNQPHLIVAFRRKRCLNRLPLDEETARGPAGDYAPTFVYLQWEFVPYHFRRHQDVEFGREILPFVRDLGPLTAGGFGDIQRLEIHPSLQDFVPHSSKHVIVVRKKLRDEYGMSDEARLALFINEKRCLRLVNDPPHPNIVPLLTAYVHGRDFCMLFPPLDMDLRAFLSRDEPYGQFRQRFTYFSALHGLASALTRVHDVRVRSDGVVFDGVGYHHDLRPVNVLVSRKTFLLADFGIGRVKEAEDGSVTRFKALAGDYVAPECMDEEFTRLDVGRAVDVWAFGCLLCEVLTYAYLGADELRNFRAARKTPRPSGSITDSLFHDGSGQVKEVVMEWIGFLAGREPQQEISVPLQELLLSIFTPVGIRPKISRVCLTLAHLSVKAHFLAALHALADVLDEGRPSPPVASHMKLWFERERLRALGSVLGLQSTTVDDVTAEFFAQNAEIYIKTLLEIFYELPQGAEFSAKDENEDENDLLLSDKTLPPRRPPNRGSLHSLSLQSEETWVDVDSDFIRGNVAHPLTTDDVDERAPLESNIQRHVDRLWGLLSAENARKAERIWIHSMLDITDNIEQLSSLERILGSQHPVAYQQGSALTMMKRIRLEILHNPIGTGLASLEIHDSCAVHLDAKLTHGHQMGVYATEGRVLIESIFYDPSWEKIPPAERTAVMAYRAMGFNPKPRPPSLRLLDCVGFFETRKDSGRGGFSFVYRIPRPTVACDPALAPSKSGVMTLNRLLILSAKKYSSRADQHTSQPMLGDKFRLASLLAGFLAEFHSTGWLHETFHSNNIVYFNVPSGLEDEGISPALSSVLREPFVVGLNKSRPGGEAWHTRGPAEDADFLDYRHPAYQHTQRFRVGYDYYSLGIVLLEIGLWTPLAAIARRREFKALSPEQLRDLLVSHYVPRLGYRMGTVYRDVVHALLSDQLDPEPEREIPAAEAESRAFSAFLEQVVGPLEKQATGSI